MTEPVCGAQIRGASPEALDPIEESCLLVAFWRSQEAQAPEPLVRDPLAEEMVERYFTPDLRDRYSRSLLFRTAVDVHAVCTHEVDERLRAWAGGQNHRQIVNLGAGLDARAYRLGLPEGMRFFHVDSAAVHAFAKDLFRDRSTATPIERVTGRVERLAEVCTELARRGVDFDAPIFWLLEGLVEFLGPRKTPEVIREIATRSAPGSAAAIQVIDSAFIDLAKELGDQEFPWRRLPKVEDVTAPLAEAGWEVSVSSPEELDRRFERGVGRLSHLVSARSPV